MNSFCVYILSYNNKRFEGESFQEFQKSTLFLDFKIITCDENTYIACLHRKLEGTGDKLISLYSFNPANENAFQHHFTRTASSTCNGIYPAGTHDQPTLILTREQGVDILAIPGGIFLSKVNSNSLPEHTLLGAPIIKSSTCLFPADHGGILHFHRNSLRRVNFNESSSSGSHVSSNHVFHALYDMQSHILLRDETNTFFIAPAQQLCDYERAHVPLRELVRTITPCSQVCLLSEPSCLPSFMILTGRGANKWMVESTYGVQLKVQEKVTCFLPTGTDGVSNKSNPVLNLKETCSDYFAFSKNGGTILCLASSQQSCLWAMKPDQKAFEQVAESSIETNAITLACGVVNDRIVQVTTKGVYWVWEGVWKFQNMHNNQMVTHAFLEETALYLILENREVVYVVIQRESISMKSILSSPSIILNSTALPRGGLAITTTNTLTIIQSPPSLQSSSSSSSLPSSSSPSMFSLTYINTLQSIASLWAFNNPLLLLIDSSSTLHYYQIQPTCLHSLHTISVETHSTLNSIQLYNEHVVLLNTPASQFILLPSCPFQFTPYSFVSPKTTNPSVINSISRYSKANQIILSTDSSMFTVIDNEVYFLSCNYNGAPLSINSNSPIIQTQTIHSIDSNRIAISPSPSQPYPRSISLSQSNEITFQYLSKTPINSMTTAMAKLPNGMVVMAVGAELMFISGPNDHPITFQLSEKCTGLRVREDGYIIAVLQHRVAILEFTTSELRELASLHVGVLNKRL